MASGDKTVPLTSKCKDSDASADGRKGKVATDGTCVAEEMVPDARVLYKVYEAPPTYMTVLLGLQHYLSMFFATLTVPFLLSKAICMDEDNVGKAEIVGTLFTASGLITLLQNTLGCRLPIVQAGTFAVLLPTLSYFDLKEWECPTGIVTEDALKNVSLTGNASHEYIFVGSAQHREIWMVRLREIQGAIMCAAMFEVVLGVTGAVGFLLRFIGPLTICPTITLLGLGMFKGAAVYGAKQWWICAATMLLIVIFSQYLGHVSVPCVAYTKTKGFHRQSYPFFKMFPIMLGMGLMWLLCHILTLSGVFPSDKDEPGYWARTDVRTDAIVSSPWFRFPYPGQWGVPTVSIAAVCAILSGILATTIESVGDYHACAKLSGAPPPPLHAVNRGIMVEGLGSFLDGLMGTGNGTTSTSINVGIIGITKVASRRVVQCSALFMIGLGVFTKFGAIFVSIPEPVIAASFFILFGMIVAVGISNVQYVDLNSGRNLFIIGFSIFNGLAIPQWVSSNQSAIDTGNTTINSICIVLLSTGMFVGGITGFILDNTIRGTAEERGIAQWQRSRDTAGALRHDPHLRREMKRVYDLPFGMALLTKYSRWTSLVPISPTYGMPQKCDLLEAAAEEDEEAGDGSDVSVSIEPESGEARTPSVRSTTKL